MFVSGDVLKGQTVNKRVEDEAANCLLSSAYCSGITSPLLNHFFHIRWQFSFKKHFFFSGRMNETKRFCMQCLSWANSETIINKLPVFCKHSSFYNFITPVSIIIKQ